MFWWKNSVGKDYIAGGNLVRRHQVAGMIHHAPDALTITRRKCQTKMNKTMIKMDGYSSDYE